METTPPFYGTPPQRGINGGIIMRRSTIVLLIIAVVLILVAACSSEPSELTRFEPPEHDVSGGGGTPASLRIIFDYEKLSGWASNQFAVWLEDTDGNHIHTLYATGWTAGGGYDKRDMSLPVWVEKSGVADMEKTAVDAISGASPGTGQVSTGITINPDELPYGEYRFFVEGTLRWNNHVIYSGVITIGDEAQTVEAEAQWLFATCDNHEALTADSDEVKMIMNVKAIYIPET